MDKTPPEVWEKIFSFACTDTGFTGRSLSLVSKYVHETSKSVKLQSIALRGYAQMLTFADLLEQTPPHLRRVRYLLVACRSWDMKIDYPPARKGECNFEERTWLEDLQMREGGSAFVNILKNVAPSLKILEVDLEYETARYARKVISLPCLTDLTTHGHFPLLAYPPHTPTLEPCRSLRRLHIKASSPGICWRDFLPHIASFAPALTHLCFSHLHQDSNFFPSDLKMALESTKLESWQPKVARLPQTIERIVVRPDVPHGEDSELLEGCRELQANDDRVVVLHALARMQPFDMRVHERDWLSVINGGEGCWAISPELDKRMRGSLDGPEPSVTIMEDRTKAN